MRTLVDVIGFATLMHLLPESSTDSVLVQTLAERWWDTTHTFHIAGQRITVTLHDFH